MGPTLGELRLAQGWFCSGLTLTWGESLGWFSCLRSWIGSTGSAAVADVVPSFSEALFKSQLGIRQRPSTRAVESASISESEWYALFLDGLWWWVGLDGGFELPAHGS